MVVLFTIVLVAVVLFVLLAGAVLLFAVGLRPRSRYDRLVRRVGPRWVHGSFPHQHPSRLHPVV
jgi:hypothetical protein